MSDQKLLYKYYPPKEYAFDALKNETICFTDLIYQNDPFETMGFYRRSYKEEYSASIMTKFYSDTDEYITNCERDSLRNWYRVFCATTRANSPLMWAHYTDSHRGMCVAYAQQDVQRYCLRLEKIRYNDTPLAKDLSVHNITNFLFFKAKDWDYENEYRGIYRLQEEDYQVLITDDIYDTDKDYLFFTQYTSPAERSIEIPKIYTVKASRRIEKKCKPQKVILGIHTSDEDTQRVKNICIENHISLYKASMKKQSFEIGTICLYNPLTKDITP